MRGVGGLTMLKVKMYVTLTFSSYGSDRDTCGGTCRGTGRRRLTRPRAATPTRRITPIIATPMRMGIIRDTPTNVHRRGIAIMSNNADLGAFDMIYKTCDIGTGTRNIGRTLIGRNCATVIICGTREGLCHMIVNAFSSETSTRGLHSSFGTGRPSGSSFRGT